MDIRESNIVIKKGQKEKFQLKFLPQNSPVEKVFYLYINSLATIF